MNENLIPFHPSVPAAPDAAIYTGPDDVVGDPNLTTADKRAILASWVSDARAVEDTPTLRRLDSGAVVEVGAILEALRGLDRSGGVVVRLPARAGRRSEPSDDDPSPTPARSGIPPHPIHVDAYGAPRRYVGGAI
jgi:hypothetical protein